MAPRPPSNPQYKIWRVNVMRGWCPQVCPSQWNLIFLSGEDDFPKFKPHLRPFIAPFYSNVHNAYLSLKRSQSMKGPNVFENLSISWMYLDLLKSSLLARICVSKDLVSEFKTRSALSSPLHIASSSSPSFYKMSESSWVNHKNWLNHCDPSFPWYHIVHGPPPPLHSVTRSVNHKN